MKQLEAVLFDMDGVITATATAHAAAWKRLFDEYLEARAARRHERFDPFDEHQEYRQFVDGRPRYEGVAQFLQSRGISLPFGQQDDGPDAETICALGNRKNRYFREWIDRHAIDAFPGAMRVVDDLRAAGVKTAVFSASRNAAVILQHAGVRDRFDAFVGGEEAAALGLPGKPHPAMLLEAASRLGVAPAHAAVVEDATAGIEAARRGGFGQVIGVDRTGDGRALARAGADATVGHLGELRLDPEAGLVLKRLSNLPSFADAAPHLRQQFSRRTPAVFLDYDGTLTPIVEDYTQAFLSEGMRTAVAALAAECPVAIVSGRDVGAVRDLVQIGSVYYAGSHGFEIAGPAGRHEHLEKGAEFLPALDSAEQALRTSLAGIAGHAIERKRFSIAVHYRRAAAADVPHLASAVEAVVSSHHGLRLGYGKKVYRVAPAIDWDKGRAVLWLLDRLGLNRLDVLPVYVGDDLTDEDAFRALAGRGLSIVVRDAEDRPTAADYAVRDTMEVRSLLEWLRGVAAGRQPSAGGPGPES